MTSGLLRGQLDARFEPLQDVLEDSLGAGADCGLSLGPVATLTRTLAGSRAAMSNETAGGISSAHRPQSASRAPIMSVLALGGTSSSTSNNTGTGTRLLSPETIGHIFREQSHGTDLFLGVPMRFGIGYGLPEPVGTPFMPDGRVCFWGGWGGSLIIMDTERRTTISYMMNKMQPGLVGSEIAAGYLKTIYELLG